MKKTFNITAALIILLTVFAGCGSTPKASGPDELDMAIRDASDYLNDNIPQGSKIVILNVQSDSAALSDYIIDELIANAVNDRLFEVVDRQQLDLIRTEQNFQWSGEVDDNAALEIGKFFGAQIIVSGRMSQIADRYRFTIRALEVQTARVVGQNNTNISAGRTITALMRSGTGGAGGTATATTASGGRTQTGTTTGGTATATQPAGPQAGTYTFFPRIQATRNGIPLEGEYINKIVVRGRNMLIYFSYLPRGTNSNRTRGSYDGFYLSAILTDLDRPSRTFNMTARQDSPEGPIVSFENVTSTRLSLETNWYGQILFEEIDLSKAEYEP
jgi:TolB-like protein